MIHVIELTAKNKLCFIDRTLTKPESTASDYKSWCRCNSMIIGWIIYALEPQIAYSILYVDGAREIWTDLEERFGQASLAQLYALEQEVLNISQDNLSVSDYYTQLKKLWDEIDNLKPLPGCDCKNCTCALTHKVLKVQQDQRLMLFLIKLSNNFANIRSHILMMTSLPTLPQAYRMLLQEQRHREISKLPNAMSDPVAFFVDNRKFSTERPNNSYQYNKNQYAGKTFVANPVKPARKTYFCDHCKIP